MILAAKMKLKNLKTVKSKNAPIGQNGWLGVLVQKLVAMAEERDNGNAYTELSVKTVSAST